MSVFSICILFSVFCILCILKICHYKGNNKGNTDRRHDKEIVSVLFISYYHYYVQKKRNAKSMSVFSICILFSAFSRSVTTKEIPKELQSEDWRKSFSLSLSITFYLDYVKMKKCRFQIFLGSVFCSLYSQDLSLQRKY